MSKINLKRIIMFSKVISTVVLISCLVACGGAQINRLPKDNPLPIQNTPTPPPPPVVAPVNPYFNTGMVGPTATFKTADGACTTFFTLQQPPPNNYYAPGTIDMFITKPTGAAGQNCYWFAGIADAFIHFNLSPDASGAFYSPGFTQGYSGVQNNCVSPCTQELRTTAGNTVPPYMIVPPPGIQAGQTITVGPTAYDQYNAAGQLTWNNIIAPASFHAGNQYWSTTFYTQTDDIPAVLVDGTPVLWKAVVDPVDTMLACSDQTEAACGHERWCFKKNIGLVRIEPLNDGHPGVPVCNLGLPTITRISP